MGKKGYNLIKERTKKSKHFKWNGSQIATMAGDTQSPSNGGEEPAKSQTLLV